MPTRLILQYVTCPQQIRLNIKTSASLDLVTLLHHTQCSQLGIM